MVLLEGIELSTSPLPREGVYVEPAGNRPLLAAHGIVVRIAFTGLRGQWHRIAQSRHATARWC